jgi:hypothetical protein
MNKSRPRPFLTALCFVLFAAAFVSANVTPATLATTASYVVEPEPLHRLAEDVRQVIHEATRPRKYD